MSDTVCICECGHPWDDHGFIDGFDMSHGMTVSNNGGPALTGEPDVLVCGGGRESASDDPWDHVCGCVLHPNTERNRRLNAELAAARGAGA